MLPKKITNRKKLQAMKEVADALGEKAASSVTKLQKIQDIVDKARFGFVSCRVIDEILKSG